MWNFQIRIPGVELQGMAGLTVGVERDALIVAAVRLRRVTIIAVQLAAVDLGNVRREMTLMIEAQDIRVACFGRSKAKFGMIARERLENLGIAARGPGQLKDHLLWRVWRSMKCIPGQLHSLLRRRFHHFAIGVAGGAIRIRHQA